MKKRPNTRRAPRLLLAAVLGALALLAAGAQTAAAAPATTQQATSRCWLDVINDWLAHNQVEGTYAIPCYTQAIQHLNEYTDIQSYSNAAQDIHQALLAILHQDRGNGGGSGTSGGSNSDGPAASGGGGTGNGGGKGSSRSTSGPIIAISNDLRPSNAQSVPLPLIVLGVLAGLLLLTGVATWVARRLHGRRGTPTAAPATAAPPRP